jgi:HlyD family secretion protein
MTADVTLLHQKVKDVVTLPMTAIQFDDNNNPYVLIEDKNSEAVKTEITTGINDGTLVEIKKGISNGQTILYTKADNSANLAFGRRPATSDTSTNTSSRENVGGSTTNG